LKVQYDELLSNFAFGFNSYILVAGLAAAATGLAPPVAALTTALTALVAS
jgi:hypothetical protein